MTARPSSAKRRLRLARLATVIPDAAKRRSGIHNPGADWKDREYGFRARACGAPRNDVELWESQNDLQARIHPGRGGDSGNRAGWMVARVRAAAADAGGPAFFRSTRQRHSR